MTTRILPLVAVLLLLATRSHAACSDPADLGIDLSQQADCDPIVPERCLLPEPNDYYTVADATSRTGRRVAFTPNGVPHNLSGTPLDTVELNRFDGFSPGSALLMWMPTVDLVQSGAPALTDLGASLGADSPVLVIDTKSGRPWPVWAELDMNSPADNRALIVRPATNFLEGHRYVIALRRMVDAGAIPIPTSPAFAAYRDGTCTTDATFESRRPHMEDLFASLRRAGVERSEVQLAWDFTIATSRTIANRMLHIRDDAFAALGRGVPAFTITSVQENPAPEFRRRIKGTFEVPLYLAGTGQPGQRFVLDANGLPQRQADPFTATFTCNLPNNDGGPARMSLYGHGLLGDQSEVNGSLVRSMSATYNVAYCATNWIGLAEEDIFNAVQILGDLSRFPSLADRLQQGFLNFLFLGRLMRHPNGFVSDPAFQADNGTALIDINQLYYDGNSQGAIAGGALCAMASDLRRCVLAEAGMNYSTLLQRSVDFDTYKVFLGLGYPDPFVQLLGLNLTQMLWDRGETDGYVEHLTRAPYPHTPRKTILLLGAVGDHQVSEFSLQVEARTIGAVGHVPYVAPDREIGGEHGFGIKPIPSYPWRHSAYFLWDTGAALSPLENVPARTGHDPHDDTPKIPAVQALKDAFWHPHGLVQDVCSGAPCTGPQF